MADLGMNIVTVIHQPRYSVFSLFHEVLLLGKAGRTVFQGLCRWTQAPPGRAPQCCKPFSCWPALLCVHCNAGDFGRPRLGHCTPQCGACNVPQSQVCMVSCAERLSELKCRRAPLRSTALPYFISIGFELPPNENPADFFLDIVSGCVPCQANPDFSTEVGTRSLQGLACDRAMPVLHIHEHAPGS